MSAKTFALDGSTVRRIKKLFALDGSTPRRVKKLFALDGSSVRLIFEDLSTFTASGTSNLIQSPVNEVVDFGVRTDFDAGGADVNVNTNGTGDANNVGSVTGITIDVDSSHTYTSTRASDIAGSSGVGVTQQSSAAFSSSAAIYLPSASQSELVTAPNASGGNTGSVNPSAVAIGGQFLSILGGNASYTNWTSGSYLTVNGTQYTGTVNPPAYGGNGSITFPDYYIRTAYYNNAAWIQKTGTGSIGNIRVAGAPAVSVSNTGRRARVTNGSPRTFTVSSGGLTAGNSFATGAISAGASTGYITANSTSEAWTLVGVAQKNPATFTITNADSSISVSGTFADGENATQARDRIQAALNANSTFQGKFNTGVDADKTISGVAHKVVTFTSDNTENTSDFSITITQNDGSNTTPYEDTTTQGATESLQTTVQVTRAVEGSQVSSTKAISSQADTDTAGAEVATLGGDITYDSGTNKLKVTDLDATVTVSNAGSLAFSKD